MGMQIVFHKMDSGSLCGWLAAPQNRKRFQGTTMASGRDLPHDLAQFVVEATLGLQHGFWGLLANGATSLGAAARNLASSSFVPTERRSMPPNIWRTLT